MGKMLKLFMTVFMTVSLLSIISCSTKVYYSPSHHVKENRKIIKKKSALEFIRYSIQVGAFQSFSNADAYGRKLDQYVDAFSFKDKDGLFKVRFGNYPSKEAARKEAEQLQFIHVIDEYFIVFPRQYRDTNVKVNHIRQQIVDDAASYIGVPYKWGGINSVTGFDCSGLSYSVYRESGVMLPRTSREQFKTGKFVLKKDLKKGDLVFFRTRGNAVSHVGIYTGNSKFIHAPSRGKTVRFQGLNSPYYQKHYAGARTYF